MKKIDNNKKSIDFIRRYFNKYYLPFTTNEIILIVVHLLLITSLFISITKSDSSRGFIILTIIIQLVILIIAFYRRIFKVIETTLTFEENLLIVHEILIKQKRVHTSIEVSGLYMFELQNKLDTETLIIFCKNNKIYINSFKAMSFYTFKSKNLLNLHQLINNKIFNHISSRSLKTV